MNEHEYQRQLCDDEATADHLDTRTRQILSEYKECLSEGYPIRYYYVYLPTGAIEFCERSKDQIEKEAHVCEMSVQDLLAESAECQCKWEMENGEI